MTDLAQVLITEAEGRSAVVYQDTRKLWTIGIGCLVDPSVPSAGLCDAAIDAQFDHDTAKTHTWAATLPGFFNCNSVRQAVLISMCFQLGDLHAWPAFKAAVAAGDYEAAAAAGYDSVWARSQTPARAKRELEMLRTGVWISKEPT